SSLVVIAPPDDKIFASGTERVSRSITALISRNPQLIFTHGPFASMGALSTVWSTIVRASELAGKVLLHRVPPRALWWRIANKFTHMLQAENRRYEFELLYIDNPDPWNYLCSPYERGKYDHALARTLKWRKASDCVLEIGCSIGVFSKMLAAHFNEVTAIDFSSEALRAAADYTRSSRNIRFVCVDLRSVKPDRQYDVIICAEI